jgi:hypothetical protein
MVLYCIVCSESDFNVGILKYLCNKCGLFTSVCKFSPFCSFYISNNNKYDASILQNKLQEEIKTKWAKFTYVSKEPTLITKIFKNTNGNVTFTTDNTIENHLATRQKQSKNKYEKCGIYQLTCPSCNMKYVGQTGRPFKARFQEHLTGFKIRKQEIQNRSTPSRK